MTTRNGLLLVDKPAGITSHDVVARARRLFNERRIGHAGTLDPMATGLLILAIGPSTRLLRFAQAESKRYTGHVLLGTATDSLDADGTVSATAPVPPLNVEEMNRVASTFLGEIFQIPPMVSAIKVDGRRLHELARQGIEVERKPRSITVQSFELTSTDSNNVWAFDVTCSTGTYVRVLLADLAERLGTLGHLQSLRRESSGPHDVRSARALEIIATMLDAGEEPLLPPISFVTDLKHVTFAPDDVRAIRQGKQVGADADADEIAGLDERGNLVAVLHRRGEKWQPEIVLPDQSVENEG
jgi:tRNA pseudouridine55 synthase